MTRVSLCEKKKQLSAKCLLLAPVKMDFATVSPFLASSRKRVPREIHHILRQCCQNNSQQT